MFCHKCGVKVMDGAHFCQKCGAKLLQDESVSASDESIAKTSVTSEIPKNSEREKNLHDSDFSQTHNHESNVSTSNSFKIFVDKHIQATTSFHSAEELLNSHMSQWRICIVPVIISILLGIFLTFSMLQDISSPSTTPIIIILLMVLGFSLFPLLIFLSVFYFLNWRKRSKYTTKFSGKFDGEVDVGEIISFLDESLNYLSPYFSKWGILKQTGYGIQSMVRVSLETSLSAKFEEVRLCTVFGKKKHVMVVLYLRPDILDRKSGHKEYFVDAKQIISFPSTGFSLYTGVYKAAPILQAAIEYYLIMKKNGESISIVENRTDTENSTTNSYHQTFSSDLHTSQADTTTIENDIGNPDKVYNENNYKLYIKPYYQKQFDLIAAGKKPSFNWAALFLNGWIQLYHGCTKIFCKTFLPVLVSLFGCFLINIIAMRTLNWRLLSITSILFVVIGLWSLVLHILNGFKFNKWYYQDIVNNPNKTRNKRNFWILLISEIIAIILLFLLSVTSLGTPTDNLLEYSEAEESSIIQDAEDSTSENNAVENSTDNAVSDDNGYSTAYAQKVQELGAEYQFNLIYLNDDEIPELVADYPGYHCSVFGWNQGRIVTIMDSFPYGAGGNSGYQYIPKGNTILDVSQDLGGAIVYPHYSTLNVNFELVDLYEEPLSIWYFNDTNGNYQIDDGELSSDEPLYYYGENQISAYEYESYKVPGSYEFIEGTLSMEETLSLLGGNPDPSLPKDHILYQGQPVSSFLGKSLQELESILGTPTDGTPVNGYLLYGGTPYCVFNDISFILDDQMKACSISTGADLVELNGQTLNRNREELIKLLGTPQHEEQLPEDESGDGHGGYYIMQYSLEENTIHCTFSMSDVNSAAYGIEIS